MPTQTTGSAASTVTFRNRDGRLVDVPTVSATRLRNEFGTVFEQATVDGAVLITKHDTPKAVLLSYAEFEALTESATPVLDDLSRTLRRAAGHHADTESQSRSRCSIQRHTAGARRRRGEGGARQAVIQRG